MKQCLLVFGLLIFLNIFEIDGATVVRDGKKSTVKTKPLRIAVIGAGPAGLVSAKHSIAQGHDVTVYEQNEELGGVWVYTDQVGKNKYGVNVHTAMYKGLRTNLPYQMMEFPDFHHSNDTASFPTQADILKFLHSYADHFELNDHIKLNHLVVRVLPVENEDGKWEVLVKDLPNNRYVTRIFDAVMVCNGHYFAPRIAPIEGANEFKGKIIHSHDFRKAEAFKGQNVLVIGTGPSGVDLVIQLSNVAKRVTLSRNRPKKETREARKRREDSLPPKTILKDNVKRFTTNGAEFIDGTTQTFTTIIYATGYNYSYPFLSVDTGIHVDDNFVQPLFKHIFNIQHPSMAFIGLPMTSNNLHLFDLQARFAIKFLSGEKTLPSKYEMLEDQMIEAQKQWNKGYPKAKTHDIARDQKEYQQQLSELADIKNLPDVFYAMYYDVSSGLKDHPTQFRKYRYTIIDEHTFIKKPEN